MVTDRLFDGALLGFGDELDDIDRLVSNEERVAELDVAQNAAEAGEHGEMLGEVRRGEKEKETDRFAVERAVGNAGNVATEKEERAFQNAGQWVAGVGEGNTVANGSGVHFFALEERGEKSFLLRFLGANLRHNRDEFAENTGFVRSGEFQMDLIGFKEIR